MVEDFFAWVKEQLSQCTVPPKSKTGQGLQDLVNLLSVSERKTGCSITQANGASANAMVYSISETAKLNSLRPYYYFRHILTELPKRCDVNGKINPAELDDLMPSSEELPDECRKSRR